MSLDPNEIGSMNLQQLVEAYVRAGDEEEQIVAEKVMLREYILPLIPDDGTIVGDYTVSRTKKGLLRLPKNAKEKLEVMAKLKELGLVKLVEKADDKMAEELFLKGVKLPCEFSYTITPRIGALSAKE